MAKTKNVNGIAIAVTVAGLILAYSGIKGIFISTAIRDLIAGKNPADEATQEPITSDTPVTGSTGLTAPSAGSSTRGGVNLPAIKIPKGTATKGTPKQPGAKSGPIIGPVRPPIVAPPPKPPSPLHTAKRIRIA